ncbi:hypothetical protein ACJJTC_017901 [Scirpophaga incertulas]
MKIILYQTDQSPPARAVKMVIYILGLDVEQRELHPVLREQDTPEMKKKNPMRTIPFIDEGDFRLSDSHAIVIYLVEKYGKNEHRHLYPKDVRKRANVNQRLFLDCGILFRQLQFIMGPVYQGQMSDIPNNIIRGIKTAYWMLEAYLNDTKFLADDVITLADICAVATVSSLDGLYPVDGERLPKTRRWLDTMQAQEFCKVKNEPGATQHVAYLKLCMEHNRHTQSKL